MLTFFAVNTNKKQYSDTLQKQIKENAPSDTQ